MTEAIPKLYVVCMKESEGAYRCFGILSNGFYFGQHLCSDPSYALNDLYGHRPNRIEALHKLFGIEPATVVWKLYTCESEDDLPQWWGPNGEPEIQGPLKAKYDEYSKLTGTLETESDLPESAHDFHD